MTLPRRATGRGVRAFSARVTRVARAGVMCCAHRRGRSGRPETRQSSKRGTSRRGRRAGLGGATTATHSSGASPARMSSHRRGAAHPSSSSTNDGGGGTILHRTTRAPTRPMRAARCRPGLMFWGVLIALLTVVCVLSSSDVRGRLNHPATYKTTQAVSSTAQWALEGHKSKIRSLGRRNPSHLDGFGLPKVEWLCAQIDGGSLPDVYWPLRDSSDLRDSRVLCEALRTLSTSLRLYTLRLSPLTRFRYWIAAKIPTFNRGYGVETYLAREIERGSFSTRGPREASALFIPVRPYLQRILTIEAYAPRDPIKGTNNNDVVRQAVRENIARDINKSKARDAKAWNSKPPCKRVVITNVDIGLSVFDESDPDVRNDAVVITGNSELPVAPGNVTDELRQRNAIQAGFDASRHVAIFFGMSEHLPREAVRMGAWNLETKRDIELSFRGSLYRGGVRKLLMPDLVALSEGRAWDLKANGQEKPRDYMRLLLNSKYSLYMYGDRVHTSRLYDVMTFGAVPVIIADQYDLPFSWLLEWSKFSVRVRESDVKSLPRILESADYDSLRRELKKVSPFFQYHQSGAVFGDAFYLTMLGVKRHLDKCKE